MCFVILQIRSDISNRNFVCRVDHCHAVSIVRRKRIDIVSLERDISSGAKTTWNKFQNKSQISNQRIWKFASLRKDSRRLLFRVFAGDTKVDARRRVSQPRGKGRKQASDNYIRWDRARRARAKDISGRVIDVRPMRFLGCFN